MAEKNNAASDWNPTAAASECDAIVTQEVSKVEVFDNDEFGGLRVVNKHGVILFRATDVAKALGQRDAEKVTRCLDADEFTHLVGTNRGTRAVSYITEPGFYRAVMNRKSAFVSDKEGRERIQRFQRWVTHEVLPAIRRDGGYMVAPEDEPPEVTMARALKIADEAIKRKDARIAEMRPKEVFADAVSTSNQTILIGDLAKLLKQNGYDTGQKRLFAWLRDNGYLMKSGASVNMPTQRAMDMGLFRVKETAVAHSDGHVTLSKTTKVTGKGQVYFVKKFLKEATA